MYAIISGGEDVACVEEPRYIRVNKNGVYVQCAPGEAQGVAVNGTPFNLPGHTEITRVVLTDEEEGITGKVTAPEAIVRKIDGGEYIKQLQDQIAAQDEELTETQLALTELYEAGLEE